MSQQTINNTIRALALGAAVAVAFAACESPPNRGDSIGPSPSVAELVLGTWVRDLGGGQSLYVHLANDGSADVWEELESVGGRQNLDLGLTWEISDAAPFGITIEGFGVLIYGSGGDALLDENGQAYHRAHEE